MNTCCSYNFKKTLNDQIIQNQDLLRLRLSPEEKKYYTDLYYNAAINGKVNCFRFRPLLGMLGTQIAQEFSDRIFKAFSSNQQEITICEYLKYIDIYHNGDDRERCTVTCKIMDLKNDGKITFDEFEDYLRLIINAIKKINLGDFNILTKDEIKILFYKISEGNEFFTYNQFENLYKEKPELISWIDYFKNNKDDVLLIVNDNIIDLLNLFNKFFSDFINEIKNFILNLNNFGNKNNNKNCLNEMIILINDFVKDFEKKQKKFFKNIKPFNIRNVFDKLLNNEIEIDKEIINKLNFNNNDDIFNYSKIYDNNENLRINKFFKKIKKNLGEFDFKNKFKKNEEEKNFDLENLSSSDDEFKSVYDENNENEETSSKKIFLNKNILYNKSFDNLIEKENNSKNIFDFNEQKTQKKNFYLNPHSNINYLPQKKSRESNSQKHSFENKTKIIINQFITEQNETYFEFFKSLGKMMLRSQEILLNINSSYNWIKKEFLNSKLKKQKLKSNNFIRTFSNNENKFSTTNVPQKIRKVKKKIIKAPDESFIILLNIIMGIQIAVQSTPNIKLNNNIEELKKYCNKMQYSIQTLNLSKKKEVYFLKEFAGIIFNDIRRLFGFDKEKFISSISPQDFITELMISSQTIFEELCSTGKSGSLFYYTRDGKFIVKTISKKEYKFLKKIVVNYYIHIKNFPLSLLPIFFGCYQLIKKVNKKKIKINFVVSKNVFSTSKIVNLRFDLKGSKIGRKVLKGNLNDNKIFEKVDVALKDLDFEIRKEKICIGNKKDEVMKLLKNDIDFLYKNGSIDYSLLLGIHFKQNKNKNERNNNNNNFFINDEKKIDISKSVKIFNNNKINLSSNDIISENNNNNNNNNEINMSNQSIILREKVLKTFYDFEDHGIESENKDKIFFIGIIDILTEYDCKKSAEHFLKKIRYCSNEMSAIPPFDYKTRFYNYMNNNVFQKNNNENNNKINNNKHIFFSEENTNVIISGEVLNNKNITISSQSDFK